MAVRRARTTAGSKVAGQSFDKQFTSGGKELRIMQSKQYPGLYEIKFYPGGEVPDVWKDHRFTAASEAQKYIDKYLAAASK